jgi:hypothetical protein
LLLTFPIYYCHEKRNFTLNLYLFDNSSCGFFFLRLLSLYLYSCSRSTSMGVSPGTALVQLHSLTANNQWSTYSGEIQHLPSCSRSCSLHYEPLSTNPLPRAVPAPAPAPAPYPAQSSQLELIQRFPPETLVFSFHSLSLFRQPLLRDS